MHESLKIEWSGQWTAKAGQDFPIHSHADAWELVYYRAGQPIIILGRERVAAQSGTVVLMPPGLPHGEIAGSGYQNFHLGFRTAEREHKLVALPQASLDLLHCLHALTLEWSSNRIHRSALMELIVRQALLLIDRSELPTQPTLLEAVHALIRTKGWTNCGVQFLANELGMSQSTFRDHFLLATGELPHRYLWRMRTEEAISMIATSDLSLEVVASRCGFDSASHLSRRIHNLKGVRPGQLRQRPHPQIEIPGPKSWE